MTSPKFASRAQWLEARIALLADEKALMRERDRLSAARRALPLVKVEQSYSFDTENGQKTLGDLFGDKSQLLVYHFMYGPDWKEGCPSCSFWADGFDGSLVHLSARDTAFACVSNAPLPVLLAYRKRMGWSFPWVSAQASSFSKDFGVTFEGNDEPVGLGYNYSGKVFGSEMPGISTFLKLEDGTIGHKYSTFSRGLDSVNATYQLLDLTPKGRDEDNLPGIMSWLRRNDSYDAA
ncbi:MAG: thioredoxin [Hyphomicrobiales bacterium]|nr:MAG: thioredoxin [Hyphomicrobiales bacterium]